MSDAPLYNVHVYREMRLFFPGIEASSPEHAARIAKDKPTAEAEATEDCHGENLSAGVDAAGDDYLLHSQCYRLRGDAAAKSCAGAFGGADCGQDCPEVS